MRNDLEQHLRAPFPTIPGWMKLLWTFRWTGREGRWNVSQVSCAIGLFKCEHCERLTGIYRSAWARHRAVTYVCKGKGKDIFFNIGGQTGKDAFLHWPTVHVQKSPTVGIEPAIVLSLGEDPVRRPKSKKVLRSEVTLPPSVNKTIDSRLDRGKHFESNCTCWQSQTAADCEKETISCRSSSTVCTHSNNVVTDDRVGTPWGRHTAKSPAKVVCHSWSRHKFTHKSVPVYINTKNYWK